MLPVMPQQGHACPTVSDDMSYVCMVQLALLAQLSYRYRAPTTGCMSNQQYLLLHDGWGAGDAVAVQSGVDGVAGPLEEGPGNALCTGCHCCGILTA